MKQITSQIETITPAIAAEYLKFNNSNRPLSQTVVSSYAATMSRGEWHLNGESIDFDWNGTLLNGQHRLQAIIKSGKSIQTFVVRNLDPKVYTSYDCGRSRNAGQLLAMQGVPNYNTVGACVRGAYMLKEGNSLSSASSGKIKNLTNYEIIKLFEADRNNYIDAGAFAISIKNRVGKTSITPSAIASIYYYLVNIKGHEDEDVRFFFENVFSFNTSSNRMLDKLRTKFLKDLSSNTKMTNEYKLNLIAKVWNAYICDKEIKSLKWNKDTEGIIEYI